jgi:hypothetical protein
MVTHPANASQAQRRPPEPAQARDASAGQSADAAGQVGLGRLLQEHRTRIPARGLWLTLAAAGWLGAALAAAAALWSWYDAYARYGPAASSGAARSWLLPAAGLAALGVLGLLGARSPSGRMVRVYEHGLIIAHRSRAQVVRWPQIRQVYTRSVRYGLPSLPFGSQSSLRLIMDDGQSLAFTQAMDELDGLAQSIKRAVYPALLEVYRQAFNAHQPVEFGRLTLTEEGLRRGRATIPWPDVGTARLENGVLEVCPRAGIRGACIRARAAGIPNVDLCLQLIRHLGQHP